jgi:hypothetical protein
VELINNYKNLLGDLVTNHLGNQKNSLNEAGVNFIFKGFFNKISGKEQELLANTMESEVNADAVWEKMPDKIKSVWKRMLTQTKNTKTLGNQSSLKNSETIKKNAKELEKYGFEKM